MSAGEAIELETSCPNSLPHFQFQNDADLVLEFVFNQGLNALVQVHTYMYIPQSQHLLPLPAQVQRQCQY